MFPFFEFHYLRLGFITIQIWGTFVAIGFLVSLLLLKKLVLIKKLDWDKILNLFLSIIAFSFVFSRLFYVFFGGNWPYFKDHLWQILAIWDGGLASTGGFLGTGVSLWLFYKKNHDNFWKYADILAFSFPFSWTIGRLGCFLIHDHPGVLTNFFLAVKFPSGSRLDMGLLESLTTLILVIIFIFLNKKPRFVKFYPIWLLFWYGITRFFLDFFRATDLSFSDPRYWGLTLAQWGSIVLIVLALKISIKRKVRIVV